MYIKKNTGKRKQVQYENWDSHQGSALLDASSEND